MASKKQTLFFTILLFSLTGLFAQENRQKTYEFDYPELKRQGDFVEVHYPNARNFGKPGAPSLPYFGIDMLLPQGHKLAGVKVAHVTYYNETRNFTVAPAKPQLPLSEIAASQGSVKPDKSIYQAKGRYPRDVLGQPRTQYLGGHGVGAFSICPVAYYPDESRVQFIKSITVKYTTEKTEDKHIRPAGRRPDITKRLKSLVDNPQALKDYTYAKPVKTADEVDMLFISSDEFLDDFQEYVDYKTATGYVVKTRSTASIYEEYEGIDEAEKIRNCIIDYYENHNLKYVILGGDADGSEEEEVIVPTRGMHATAGGNADDNIPADMYYSGLDGSWNNDGDEKWGENGEEDILAEVYVGRFSVDDATEIAHMTNKHKAYQDNPVEADVNKALMVGELLWENPDTYGGDYKDEVAYGSSANGYTTEGFSDNFTITEMYQRDEDWSIEEIFDVFNNEGLNILNHLGHANVTYSLTMTTDDLNTTNFTNDGENRGFPLVYSQGCYCGSFDNRDSYGNFGTEDCFAERFATMETGAVATIMNSRYGWGMQGSTDGASQYFDRQFFDAVFNEEHYALGVANADSKEDNISYMDESVMRWACFEINLLGDPSMHLWTRQPEPINANYNEGMPLGGSQIEFSTNAPGARIGLMQDEELIGRTLADSTGNVTLHLFEPLASPEPISVSIIAPNKERHTGTIYVFSEAPYVALDSFAIDDAAHNANNQADYGETPLLDIQLKNFSDSYAAAAVKDSLYTDDPYISLSDSVQVFGNIAPDAVSLITGAFEFAVSDTVPDQHTADFTMHVTGQDTVNDTSLVWSSGFRMTLNAPKLSIGELSVLDTAAGDGDGILDPGETAQLQMAVSNTGHASANAILGVLSTTSDKLVLNSTRDTVQQFAADSTLILSFSVTSASDVPLGTPAAIELNAEVQENDYYSGSSVKEVIIGEMPEYLISEEGTVNTCAALFYDSGGSGQGYGNDESYTMTFKPGTSGKVIKASFLGFGVESGYDWLKIYDGTSTNAPLIGSYDSGNAPETVIADNMSGSLTFEFYSDGMVTEAGWEAEIRCVKMNQVDFQVNDGNSPLPGTEIHFAGTTLMTDSLGIASFLVENGAYDYTVSKTGYEEVTGNIEVTAGETHEVTLQVLRYDITFNLYQEDGSTPIDGEIEFNGTTQQTAEGTYTFNDVAYGLSKGYQVSVSDDYYTHYTDSVDVIKDKTLDITMPARLYNVKMTALDTTGSPVPDCKIMVNDQTYITKSNGLAEMKLARGNHSYTVSHPGYAGESGMLAITGDTGSYAFITELTIENYAVNFQVYERDSLTPVNASVTFNGETKSADNGSCRFEQVVYNGQMEYTIRAEEHNNVQSGVHLVQDTTLQVYMDSTQYEVEVITEDESGNAVFGADVILAGDLKMTGITGNASFDVVKGHYQIRATKTGFGITREPLQVENDTTYQVILKRLHAVTLYALTDSASTPVPQAAFVIGTDTVFTNANGVADTSLVAGRYPVRLQADGYQPVQDTLPVTGNYTREFMLQAMSYPVEFAVRDSATGEPIHDARIAVAEDTLYTNGEGSASLALAHGNYPYKAVAPEYKPADGNLQVLGATTVSISLVKKATGLSTRTGKLHIYPNPASGWLMIEYPHAAPLHYELFDLTGKSLVKGFLLKANNRIDLTPYHPGMYMLRIRNGQKQKNVQLIIK